MRWVALVLATVLLGIGCKTIPAAEAPEPTGARTVSVVGGSGAVAQRSSGELASRAGDGRNNMLRHYLDYMEALGGPPLVAGNAARLLIDGPAAYEAMFSAIAQARDHINMEVYIFQDDEVGRDLVGLLVQKQREGVQVNLIYDSLGSLQTPQDMFAQLRDAGAQILEFNPVNPLSGKLLELNNRDHRKILIVDGAVAYTGGINISSVYSSGSAPTARKKPSADAGWRDTQIEVRGPAALDFQRLFIDVWQQHDGAALAPRNYFPKPAPAGDKYVRVIGSAPGDTVNLIYSDLLAAIEHARTSVHLTMAYFGPDQRLLDALTAAAGRGVEVVLVLPGFSDFWVVFHAGRSHYSELLDAGVQIYERRDALLHAKTMVIDGVWSAVGSSNMDMRSFLHNNEVNAVVLGEDFGAQMEAMFRQDLARSKNISPADWHRRSLKVRTQEWFSRLWSYWL